MVEFFAYNESVIGSNPMLPKKLWYTLNPFRSKMLLPNLTHLNTSLLGTVHIYKNKI